MKSNQLALAGEPSQTIIPNRMNPPLRILIADNDLFLRRLEAEALRCAGYKVDEVEHGVDTWDLLQQNKYDLLVTDDNMAMDSGMGLLELIQAAHLTVLVIMTTENLTAGESTANPGRQPPMMLFKPYTVTEFLGVVKDVLHEADTASIVITTAIWQSQEQVHGLQR